MATGQFLSYAAGVAPSALTNDISVNPGDYVLAFVSGWNIDFATIVSNLPGPPNLSRRRILQPDPSSNWKVAVHGAVVTTGNSSFKYQVNTSSGPFDGAFAAIFFKVVPATNEILALTNSIVEQDVSGTSASVTTSTAPQNNDVIFGFHGLSASTNFTDSDTTNGSWSTRYSATSGGNIYANAQFKNVTGEGNQTYNGSWSPSTDGNRDMGVFLVTISATIPTLSYWGVLA